MIFNFVKFIATKKIRQQIFCPSSFLLLDPGYKMEKAGSGINIPDPQHCLCLHMLTVS